MQVETPAIDVVDTVGAGDSFQAALLFALRDIGRIKRSELAQMNASELGRALSFCKAARDYGPKTAKCQTATENITVNHIEIRRSA